MRNFLRAVPKQGFEVCSVSVAIGFFLVIGAMIHSVFLSPLPVAGEERVALLWQGSSQSNSPRDLWADRNLADVERALAGVWRVEFFGFSRGHYRDGLAQRPVETAEVSAGLLDMIGARPIAGRLPTVDETSGLPMPVLITEQCWQRLFGRDSAVLNTTRTLDGDLVKILGVTPSRVTRFFELFEHRPEILFVKNNESRSSNRAAKHFIAIVRPRDHQTVADLRGRLPSLSRELQEADPRANAGLRLRITPLRPYIIDPWRVPLLLALGAALLLLLASALSIGSLRFSSELGRLREYGVRLALGATPARLARRVLAESLTLLGLSTLGGMALAAMALPIAAARMEALKMPALAMLTLSPAVLGIALPGLILVWIVSSIAILPLAVRANPSAALRGDVLNSARGGSRRIQQIFLGLQIFFSVVALVATASLFSQVRQWRREAIGSQYDGVAALNLEYTPDIEALHISSNAAFDTHIRSYFPPILDAIRRRSADGRIGVLSSPVLPFQRRSVVFSGPGLRRDVPTLAPLVMVQASYFDFLGLRIANGRTCAPNDGESGAVLVNQAFVRQFGERGGPIGHVLQIGNASRANEIVGIVVDAPGFDSATVYQCVQAQFVTVLFHPRGDPRLEAQSIANEIARSYPELEIRASLVSEEASAAAMKTGVQMNLFAAIAMASVWLSAFGAYALCRRFISANRANLKIRRSLGARDRHIAVWLARNAGVPIVLGIVAALLTGFLLWSRFDPHLVQNAGLPWKIIVLGAACVILLWVIAIGIPLAAATRIKPGDPAKI